MLATTGDYLRLWHVTDNKVELKAMLNNKQNSEYCAPLTSFDWNENDTNRIGTCSIDTTCTIWDIEKEVVDTQLIAHDKEVRATEILPTPDGGCWPGQRDRTNAPQACSSLRGVFGARLQPLLPLLRTH